MAVINYTIQSGAAPFTAELTPSLIPVNIHNETGTFQFNDVPDGNYTLIIKDSNECVFEQELNVDPLVTTTTTTIPSGDLIVVGQAQDDLLIFNPDATNRDQKYVGFPDENIVMLYLWLKTLNGAPLTEQKSISYNISGGVDNTFSFVGLSDEMNAEVIESVEGAAESISGQIILKEGFIETFFEYIYVKNPSNPTLRVELNSTINWLYEDIPLVDNNNQYGVTYIDGDNVVMNF